MQRAWVHDQHYSVARHPRLAISVLLDVREGSGPPLLLMHGWPGFWWEWYKCIDRLAKHFDVILPDFRGYRDSEKPNLADISKFHLDLVTEDQANLLHYLKIPKAYVVGHDYSALVMHKFVRKPAFDKCCPETGKLERNKSGLKTKWK